MGNGVFSGADAPKNVFLLVSEGNDSRKQKITFGRHSSPSEIRELIIEAAGANRNANVTLRSTEGSLVTVSASMPTNKESHPYAVTIIEPAEELDNVRENNEALQMVLHHVADQFSQVFKINDLKDELLERMNIMERRVEMEGLKAIEIERCKKDLANIKDHIVAAQSYIKQNKPTKRLSMKRDVPSYPKYTLSAETIDYLKKPTFDIWHWEPNEMLSLLEHMYHELGLVKEFNINPVTLKRWLLCVQENYRNNPFHNFQHCFCVSQMMYGMVNLCKLWEKMTKFDLGVLLTSCVCHDLDHPGYNNAYQINARTELAIRYNDMSPLENHHCAVAFSIFNNPDTNIFSNISSEDFKRVRQGMINLILATDMARHSEILESFKSKLDDFDFTIDEHLEVFKMIMIKCCDISNEVRPMEVSEPWVDCLLEEYFMQSDREKSEGLPVAPFMDREKVTKPGAQIGFIKYVLIPMFECVAKLFSEIDHVMVQPLRNSYKHYEELKEMEEADNKIYKKK